MSSYLDIPKNERLSLPLRQWPESDLANWLRALTIESSIRQRIQPVMWRLRYRLDCEKSYGVYLRWLRDDALVGLDTPLATRTARDNVVRFIRWHRALGYAPATIATRVERLHMVVQVIEPDTDWLWFYDLRKALNHAVIESVRFQENLPEVSALWRLGWALMRSARDIEVLYEERRATRFRAGLMIAMLAACPCRTGNLVAMSVDRNLTRTGISQEEDTSTSCHSTATK